MDSTTVIRLRKIGQQLDEGIFPNVFNDGIVALNDSAASTATVGAEKKNEPTRQKRSSTGSWQGTARWQRQAGRSRSPGNSAPVVSPVLREEYRRQLDGIMAAYPRTAVWRHEEGLWLSVESAIIAGFNRRATFIVALPYFENAIPKAWGFWTTHISWDWIGPRHTNFPDGSICAFEPRDASWVTGGDIVSLLDLYTLWALRHLHLNFVGHWPGRQSVTHAYERLVELKDEEFCGCDSGQLRYADCCKQADMAADRNALASDFLVNFSKFQPRRVPPRIQRILTHREGPPSFTEDLV